MLSISLEVFFEDRTWVDVQMARDLIALLVLDFQVALLPSRALIKPVPESGSPAPLWGGAALYQRGRPPSRPIPDCQQDLGPLRVSTWAVSRPMPLLAPVKTATRPACAGSSCPLQAMRDAPDPSIGGLGLSAQARHTGRCASGLVRAGER